MLTVFVPLAPVVMVTREEVTSLPVAIAFTASRDRLRWEVMLTSIGVITIPVITIVALFQRYLLQKFAATATR